MFGLFRAHLQFSIIFGFRPGSGLHFRVRAGFGPDLVGPLTTLCGVILSGNCVIFGIYNQRMTLAVAQMYINIPVALKSREHRKVYFFQFPRKINGRKNVLFVFSKLFLPFLKILWSSVITTGLAEKDYTRASSSIIGNRFYKGNKINQLWVEKLSMSYLETLSQ